MRVSSPSALCTRHNITIRACHFTNKKTRVPKRDTCDLLATMREDEVEPRIVKELASAMSPYDLTQYAAEDLVAAGKALTRSRRNQQVITGQIAAALWTIDQKTYSWRAMAAEFETPRTTIHRWARPFLKGA